jgi:hypothetical protein
MIFQFLESAEMPETAEEFFRRRARGAAKGLNHYLDMVPDLPPDPGDELPEGWKPQ